MRNTIALYAGALALGVTCTFALATSSSAQDAPAPESAGVQSGAQPLMMLRLFDGSILWGSIIGHDAKSLAFQRLDNGGKVYLPWSRLDPTLADELLETYGYVDHSGDELMVEAQRLELADGTVLVGIIVNRTETELWIKNSSAVVPVPKLRLKSGATTVQVPALDVYTREELYQQELSNLDPTNAGSEVTLATFCERIFDFAHAIEHTEAALKLDPSKSSELGITLERNRQKLKNQAQIDMLRDIDHDRAGARFDAALKKCDAFLATYADSPLRQDATRKKQQITKAREAYVRERVIELWHRWLGTLTNKSGGDPARTLEASLAWLDQGLGDEVKTNVTKELAKTIGGEITPDLVAKYWKERKNERWRRASYGQGTWLLGDAEARKGLEPEKKPAAAPNETDAARAKLEDRIKRYLQNQEVIKKTQGKTKDEQSEQEKFWKEYSVFSRAQWLLAYYCEHSGDMQLREPSFSNCPDCNGTGVRTVLNTGGSRQGQTGASEQIIDCPTCHHVGVLRRVNYH
jgi:hypothetical protein